MPTSVSDVLILLAAVIGSGSIVGVGMWLYFRVRRLEDENKDLVQLTERIDALRDQLAAVQEQVGDLYERIDFTERVMAQVKGSKPELPPG